MDALQPHNLNIGHGPANLPGILFQLSDNRPIPWQQADDLKPASGGTIETVTVVAYPSGYLTTLTPSHTTQEESRSSSPSSDLSRTETSDGFSEASSSSLAGPSSISTTLASSTPSPLAVQPSSTPQYSSATSSGPSHSQKTGGVSTSGSNLASLEPPVYVGIALGSIVAFAILIALIAWCIRTWYRRRGRNSVSAPPWAQQDAESFSRLEAGSKSNADWSAGSEPQSDSRRADSTRSFTRRWSYADHDVGEPHSSDGYGNVLDFLYGRHIPNHQLSSDGVGARTMDANYPPHTRKPTIRRQLPSHLVSSNLSPQAQAPRPDEVGCEYDLGTPREDVVVPRYLRLDGNALDLPWTNNNPEPAPPPPPPPRSMAERLRRASRPVKESWEHPGPSDLSPGPNPGARQGKADGWAGSITSNLVTAFNAVAANIATFNADGEAPASGMALPKPSSRGTSRKDTLPDSPSDMSMGGGNGQHYGGIHSPNMSTESNMPWTLEEIADGTGVVHLHISPSKERSGSLARAPSSLYRSDSSSSVPLVASHIPQPALMKAEISHHFRAQPDFVPSSQNGHRLLEPSNSTRTITSSSPPRGLHERWKRSVRKGSQDDRLSPASYRPGPSGSGVSRLSSTSSGTSWNSFSSPAATNQVAEVLRARRRPLSKT
ncbi:hypothetical protein D9611_009954 [Ephemerocybe angulata]|uniref:Uncharacterized protein n=2 Tax=Ephemerocybe angulata TaxID=980116 RepID=A0A8H5FF81_9AGAR|nr:hypothetical protein D9611_009954 [Tulosesus angulatus]KAF6750436.1 hypothetical protein DFP72DRAFT_911165 [Tulosesus angulatus]